MEFDLKKQAKEEFDIKKQVKNTGLLQSEELHNVSLAFNLAFKLLIHYIDLWIYILETSVYPREAEPLKELREATENHPKSFMAGAPIAGQMISFLLKKENAKKTIEVGVFTGYSLLLTALSIPDDGKITAIDCDREAYEIGLPFIKKAGVEGKIDFIESNAHLALDNLLLNPKNEGSFDFAFVDADKPSYQHYHERLIKLVKVGGVIAYDNTLWGGTVAMPESQVPDFMKEYREAIMKLNKSLAADPRIDIAQLPLGDGITFCRRLY